MFTKVAALASGMGAEELAAERKRRARNWAIGGGIAGGLVLPVLGIAPGAILGHRHGKKSFDAEYDLAVKAGRLKRYKLDNK